MLNCPLIEAERLDEQMFDHTPELIVTGSSDLSSEFPWLGAADTGNEINEFTKNLGGNNGTFTLTNGK